MIGVVELLLFLTPFAAFLAWRLLAPVLPRASVWAAAGLVVAIGLAAAWTASRPSLHHGQRYAPAQLRDGAIMPGQAVR